MSEYLVSEIKENDKRGQRLMRELLVKEGIEKDGNLDYSLGIFDEDYNLLATGSCFKNTLRCMAVDSNRQGEGLLNKIVTALIEHQYAIGNRDLFLYTKCDSAKFFEDLGFYEIARVDGKVVFMENKKDGFEKYLDGLKAETDEFISEHGFKDGAAISSIVMNANPFTLGHQYLVEEASKASDLVHLFVVSEDASYVPADIRYDLVKKGIAHLNNVIVHKSGSYIISSATFPSYFLKDELNVVTSHARLDINVFSKIANALGIKMRFVGTEPFSKTTDTYNSVMREELPVAGVDVKVVERREEGDMAISATKVRELIQAGDIEAIKPLVPASTYEYFK